MTEFDGVVTILNEPAPTGQRMITLDGPVGVVALWNREGNEIARIGYVPPNLIPPHPQPVSGGLVLKGPAGEERIQLIGALGDAVLGGNGVDGDLSLQSSASNAVVSLNGGVGDAMAVRDESADRKILFAFDKDAFNKKRAGLFLGAHSNQGGTKPGYIHLRDDVGKGGIVLHGGSGEDNIAVDEPGKRLFAFDKDAFNKKRAGLFLGAHSNQGGKKPGYIAVRGNQGQDSIVIDGEKGDILLANADCAEEFELAPGPEVEPATVMVIDQNGMLTPSKDPYDRTVAGVASGDSDTRPGIVLGHRPGDGRRLAIALAGRVQCRVDSDYAPIEVGDLLTTSATPGHAMKATDPSRAFGSVIGKALRPLTSGRGAIPVLVALH